MSEDESAATGPFVCSSCEANSDTGEGWLIRATEEGQLALCPTCTSVAQQQLDQQSQGINMPRAALFGALAALVGGGVWYGLVVATNYKLGIVAIGVGWLVGKGVVLGASNKRSVSLQVVGGVLALLALVVGEYLIINHLVRQTFEEFTGWLTLGHFIELYPQVLMADDTWYLDIVFYLIALYEGVIQPRPLKLKA